MFADPASTAGNRGKAAWKMINFPGVMANNAANARNYRDGRRLPKRRALGIADMP